MPTNKDVFCDLVTQKKILAHATGIDAAILTRLHGAIGEVEKLGPQMREIRARHAKAAQTAVLCMDMLYDAHGDASADAINAEIEARRAQRKGESTPAPAPKAPKPATPAPLAKKKPKR